MGLVQIEEFALLGFVIFLAALLLVQRRLRPPEPNLDLDVLELATGPYSRRQTLMSGDGTPYEVRAVTLVEQRVQGARFAPDDDEIEPVVIPEGEEEEEVTDEDDAVALSDDGLDEEEGPGDVLEEEDECQHGDDGDGDGDAGDASAFGAGASAFGAAAGGCEQAAEHPLLAVLTPAGHFEKVATDAMSKTPSVAAGALAAMKRSPWIWAGSPKRRRWRCAQFPWTNFSIEILLRRYGVELPNSAEPARARMVQHLVKASMFFVVHMQRLEEIVSLLCVRVRDPDGRYLVKVSERKLRRGLTYHKRQTGRWSVAGPQTEGRGSLQAGISGIGQAQWPSKECAEPKDVIAAAASLIEDQAGVPRGCVTFRVGGVSWSCARDDQYLGLPCRLCRHFVDAELNQPVAPSIYDKLCLEEGSYSHSRAHGQLSQYEWWDASICAAKLPGGVPLGAPRKLVRGSMFCEASDLAPADVLYSSLQPALPWTEETVREVMRGYGAQGPLTPNGVLVKGALSRSSQEEAASADLHPKRIAERLNRGDWALLHGPSSSKDEDAQESSTEKPAQPQGALYICQRSCLHK
eukprot:TRINITY_DN29073_c0_g2_i1.p1 TRINITY_DN29073_c0_g2~~TRINITY_DN29073_c0_g2_i1.p1  ORF type:complete len:616 (-),score=124.36 TRINITY_DN29073_c0_g2_i1:49-1779(-)